jgi:hypothetical protein
MMILMLTNKYGYENHYLNAKSIMTGTRHSRAWEQGPKVTADVQSSKLKQLMGQIKQS